MTLSTVDPASKACWESSSCKGGIGARCDWLLEFVFLCVCVYSQCADVRFGVFRVTEPQAACAGQWNIW